MGYWLLVILCRKGAINFVSGYLAADGTVCEMGLDEVTCLQFLYGPHHLAVLREQAVSLSIDTLWVACGETLFEHLHAVPADEYLSFRRTMQTQQQVLHASHLFVHAVDEPFGDGSRCLE